MNTTRIIEAYLDGSLDKDLANEIRIRAENDTDLAELIRLHKEINASIGDDELEKLRFTLKKISSEKGLTDYKIGVPIRRIIQIAAACLFLIVIGSATKKWFFTGAEEYSVFEKYYVKYEPDVITRSENSGTNNLENAQILYQTGNYAKSAAILSELTSRDRNNYIAWFYAGLVKIELKETTEAARNFMKIPPQWKSPYLMHRNWYLALCLIKTGHEKEAGELLIQLSTGNKFYSERARKILKEIRI